jgi:hypothetical protein
MITQSAGHRCLDHDVVGKQNSVVTPSRLRISTTAWSARIRPPCELEKAYGAMGRLNPTVARSRFDRADASTVRIWLDNPGRRHDNPPPRLLARRRRRCCRRTRAADKPIRIGVLTDMAGPAPPIPARSVLGAQMVEDFCATTLDQGGSVQADLQLKPDVAVAITRDWCDNQGVMVTDAPSAAFRRRHGEAEGQGSTSPVPLRHHL